MAFRLRPSSVSIAVNSISRTGHHLVRDSHAQRLQLKLAQPLQTRRSMASHLRPDITTPPAGKFEFLVVVPDKPGMQQKRLEVRRMHFENMKPHLASGAWKMGGAVLSETPTSDDPTTWDFHGSTLVVIAETKEEVLEGLRKDIYTSSGVWDTENAQIWPVKILFRYP